MKKIREINIRLPINRFLDSEDLANHLRQGQPIERMTQQDLMSDLSVIKLNSSFLEVADAHYKDRGLLLLLVYYSFF
ncbi:hypothetical protein MMK73_004631 [Providencia rettgeri]